MDKDILGEYALKVVAVGSRITCNPAPTDTDEDYLVLLKDKELLEDFDSELAASGYVIGGSEVVDMADENPNYFRAYKSPKTVINYIVTGNQEFFDKFIYASNIAKKLNLLDKEQRVNLFQIILYNNFGYEVCRELLEHGVEDWVCRDFKKIGG